MRKVVWAVAIGGALGLAVGVASIPRIVEKKVVATFARRGIEARVGTLGFSWRGLELEDLSLRIPERVEANLGRVQVDLDWWALAPEDVAVSGGKVELGGSLEEMRSTWVRLKGAEGGGEPSGRGGRYATVRGVQVAWKRPLGEDTALRLDRIEVDHGPGGSKLGIEEMVLETAAGSATLRGTVLEFVRNEAGFSIEKAALRELLLSERAHPERSKDVASAPASTPKKLPEDSGADDAGDLPSLLSVDRERGKKLRDLLGRFRRELLPRLPARAEIRRVTLEVTSDSERLHLVPGLFTLLRHDGAVEFALSPESEQSEGRKLALKLRVPEQEGKVSLEFSGGPVTLQELGVVEKDFGLVETARASLAVEARLDFEEASESFVGDSKVSLEGFALESDKLAPMRVLVPRIQSGFHLSGKVDGTELRVSEAELGVGEMRFKGNLELLLGDRPGLSLDVSAPLVSCQSVLNSLPLALMGSVKDMTLEGTLKFDTKADFHLLPKFVSKVEVNVAGDCAVKRVPPLLDPAQFRSAFVREVQGPGDVPVPLEFGPTSPNWTPYGVIAEVLTKAVLVTEDGRFFRHPGIDQRALESAIADNVRAGRFVRGASTISMQLAKNLYLNREKRISRKLQELFLTMLLEQSFKKEELLELYFNVVEFGPMVYGVRHAADHYFRSTPQELTTMQAFFLASILPNPKKHYFDRSGALLPGHAKLLSRLVGIAAERKLLTPEQQKAAEAERLVFGRKSTTPEEAADFAPPAPEVAAPSVGAPAP